MKFKDYYVGYIQDRNVEAVAVDHNEKDAWDVVVDIRNDNQNRLYIDNLHNVIVEYVNESSEHRVSFELKTFNDIASLKDEEVVVYVIDVYTGDIIEINTNEMTIVNRTTNMPVTFRI